MQEEQLAFDWDDKDDFLATLFGEKGARQGFRNFMHRISETHRRAGALYTAQLQTAGYRVFDAKTFNDDDSVEGDYGAPLHGLDFFPQLIDPARSFRYTRVRIIEGEYKTHHEQAMAVGRYLKKRGYKIFNGSADGDYATNIHFCNGGVTRGFTHTLRSIIDEYMRGRADRIANDMDFHGAFLMPVPTYGLFYYLAKDMLKGTGIGLQTIRRNDDGSVNQAHLANTLNDYKSRKIRAVGYYDCNPHNPTGYIRTAQETRDTAAILMAESDRYKKDDLEEVNYLPLGFQAMVARMDKPHGGIVIIDDMAYEGLEHITDKKPFSFGQVSPAVAEQTLVLKGVSKIGLPGMRIGMMIGHHELTGPLAEPQLMEEFSAATPGVDVLSKRYSAGPHQKLFADHVRKLRRAHRRHAGYVQAFVNGLDNVKHLSRNDKNTLVSAYAAHAGISKKQARENLSQGLPNFYLNEKTESGFFMIINADNMTGQPIAIRYDGHDFPVFRPVNDSYTLYGVFKAFGIDVVSAGSQGAHPRCMQARITLSLSLDELLTMYTRLRNMHDYFFGEKPHVQMDLFRKNPSALRSLTCA